MVDLTIPWHPGDDVGELLSREWLVTNGLGGYASGSVGVVPTRRYHGLFVPNLPSPRGRTVMITRFEEDAIHDGGRTSLSAAELPDGTMTADVGESLEDFRLTWRTPVWRYHFAGRRLQRRIVMPHGQNTVFVEYRLLEGGPIRLHLRPYLAFRMHDGPLGSARDWPFAVTICRGRIAVSPFEGAATLRLALRPRGGVFVAKDRWSGLVLYRLERDRGNDHLEDVPSPGYFAVELRRGESVALVASTEAWDSLEIEPAAVFDAEHRRLKRLLALAAPAARTGTAAQLVLAADQFVVSPASRPDETVRASAEGDEVRTIIAGYHWFTDWGRDTMISLDGLTLVTGRHREARAILRTFSRYVKDGLIPNLFPEGHRTGLYHTVDATLWYFHAIDRYYTATRDDDTLELLYPVLESIVGHYEAGTDFGIGVDADGLVHAAAEGYQLTWMDAKVDGWVVTPRRGKPVEIQALWYNALRLMETWAAKLGRPAGHFAELAERAYASFNARFPFGDSGYLHDVVDGEDGDDASLRPNQVFAISLRFPILERARWSRVLDIVRDRLVTPYGLRTLDPSDPDYHAHYEGDLRTRDAAYHQGLVWTWLIGHFLDAWRKTHPGEPDGERFFAAFAEHLRDAGVGTISEIFDAEPPYVARGCIAQAWSVAEVLRSLVAIHDGGGDGPGR